jgi:hypothetical protein
LLIAIASLVSLGSARGQSGWKAGAAKVDITPQEPIWLAGYAARLKPSEGIRKDLYVTALALQDGTGTTSVLVTFDLVGIGREWGQVVTDRCQKQFGLTRDRIILNASHTHSGPVVGDTPPYYAPMTAADAEVARRYTSRLLDQTVDAVGKAIRDLSPARLDFEQGLAGIAVNRRRVRLRSLPGPVDQDVPVLSVRGLNGELRAVVVGYSCHATALGDYQISGDWPGYAKDEIEKAHPGTVVLFVQGCGADANPLPRYQGTDPAMLHYSVELAEMYGKILAAAVDLVLHEKMRPLEGPLKTAFEPVDIPIRTPTREHLQSWLNGPDRNERSAGKMLLAKLDREGKLPDRYSYPVQVWQFGRGLTFIALAGEVVVDYSLRLKAKYGWDDTWVAGYSNDVFAYIPSLRVLREGGYEGGDANRDLGGPFGAAVEEIIIEKVGDLVERTNPR